MPFRIGVDAGGTFTDVFLVDEDSSETAITKISSTPADPGRAVISGVFQILAEYYDSAAAENSMDQVSYFAHGTTVATNALLQSAGVRTGLLTTAGFCDLLELGRQRRPKLYDLNARKPEPFVPRDLRLEVAERLRHDGRVEVELDREQVRAHVRRLREADVEAVAVCLLYSYVSPKHEQQIGEIVREEFPEAFVSLSSEVLPEFREYERLSTVVTNAYVGPIMARYLGGLREALADAGLSCTPYVTQSNGGIISFAESERLPVRTALSGPSTGVVGAAQVGLRAGFADVMTFDMGGTSTDVSLVSAGEPRTVNGVEIDGRPVHAPMLDIHTVGAGGGSIAWTDSGGHLKVGPRSASAEPGPACYGAGGAEPTVTDANVVLGILHQAHLLAGTMPIDAGASGEVIAPLADRLELSVDETAAGILSVVTANMARALRIISVQRGHDPRDYCLVAFGGAGPLHAGRLARELDIPHVLVPRQPGALSALGMLTTDLRTDHSRTQVVRLDSPGVETCATVFAGLRAEAESWFEHEEIEPERRIIRRVIDLRYVGQNYELAVPVGSGDLDAAQVEVLRAGFDAAHERLYGYHAPDDTVEAVTFRVEAIGRIESTNAPPGELGPPDPSAALVDERELYLPERGERIGVGVYDRARLRPGHRLPAPCVVDQYDTTTLVLPGDRPVVDGDNNIVITVGGSR